jgi:hypothetical protein
VGNTLSQISTGSSDLLSSIRTREWTVNRTRKIEKYWRCTLLRWRVSTRPARPPINERKIIPTRSQTTASFVTGAHNYDKTTSILSETFVIYYIGGITFFREHALYHFNQPAPKQTGAAVSLTGRKRSCPSISYGGFDWRFCFDYYSLIFFIFLLLLLLWFYTVLYRPRGWIVWPIPGPRRQLRVSTTLFDWYDSSKTMLLIAHERNYTLRAHPKGVLSRADQCVFSSI